MDRNLGDICGRVHDALPPRLARAVCIALVGAVQSVLLDGGPFRWAPTRLLTFFKPPILAVGSRLLSSSNPTLQQPGRPAASCGLPASNDAMEPSR